MSKLITAMALFVAMALVSGCAATAVVADEGAGWNPDFGFFVPPNWTLDLDKPAVERWAGAVELVVKKHGFDHTFGPVFDLYFPFFEQLPAAVPAGIRKFLKANNRELHDEVIGIMNALAPYCATCNTTDMMFNWVYFYELSHAKELQAFLPRDVLRSCTGILTLPEDMSENILHGRNMDLHPASGRNATLNITAVKGGKPIYQLVGWSWISAGDPTASRLGALTLEMNWRNHGHLSLKQIVDVITTATTVPVLQNFRIINERGLAFDEAVSFVMSSHYAAPFYNIISGTERRGAVLTISFNKTESNVAEYINDTCKETFMVQTNYDRWLPDPPSDPRRTAAEDHLKMIGRHRSGTDLGLWMTLSSYPVKNPHTMYSALMNVGRAADVYVRRLMLPEGV